MNNVEKSYTTFPMMSSSEKPNVRTLFFLVLPCMSSLILVFCFIFYLSVQAGDQENRKYFIIGKQLDQASELVDLRQYSEAIRIYHSIKRKEIGNKLALKALRKIANMAKKEADIFYQAGKMEDSSYWVNLGLMAVPDDTKLLYLFNEIEKNRNEYQAISDRSPSIFLLLSLGDIYYQAGFWSKPNNGNAIQLYKAILEVEEDNILAKNALSRIANESMKFAKINLDWGQLKDAAKWVSVGLKAAPNSLKLEKINKNLLTEMTKYYPKHELLLGNNPESWFHSTCDVSCIQECEGVENTLFFSVNLPINADYLADNMGNIELKQSLSYVHDRLKLCARSNSCRIEYCTFSNKKKCTVNFSRAKFFSSHQKNEGLWPVDCQFSKLACNAGILGYCESK